MNELDRYAVSLENMEVLRAQVEEQAREIERLHRDYDEACEDAMAVARQLADLKAQPRGVVRWPEADEIMQMAFEEGQPGEDASGYYFELEEFDLFIQRLMDEVARLNSSPVSAGDENSEEGLEEWAKGKFGVGGRYTGKLYGNTDWALARVVWSAALSAPSHGELAVLREYRTAIRNFNDCHGVETDTLDEAVEIERKAEARLEAAEKACHDFYAGRNPEPSHSEQVREGWQLVPVEPTDAMLEAGDKYIGTPATYKSMLSACPSPAITKDFSQFLSAVMDAAGLIRHGRQSKELSEYLGMKCMEYRGAAPSAGSQGGDA